MIDRANLFEGTVESTNRVVVTVRENEIDEIEKISIGHFGDSADRLALDGASLSVSQQSNSDIR